jgi:hypothetical protein
VLLDATATFPDAPVSASTVMAAGTHGGLTNRVPR